MQIQTSAFRPAPSVASRASTTDVTLSSTELPAYRDGVSLGNRSRLGDFAEGAKLLVTKLGPAAAVTGAAATYAHSVGGVGLAATALVGVPLAAAGVSLFLESLNFGGGPNYGGAKGLNAMLTGGAGFAGGLVGAVVGAHYGSALVGAAAGAVAPVALTAVALGGLAIFS